jgi:hypothetical protein
VASKTGVVRKQAPQIFDCVWGILRPQIAQRAGMLAKNCLLHAMQMASLLLA